MLEKINNILILDTETTHLEPEKGELIEIATVLYNVPHRTILQQSSTLLPVKSNDAFKINRIDPIVTNNCDYSRSNMATAIILQAFHAEAIVAHNAEFDKKWIFHHNKIAKNGQSEFALSSLEDLPWICTYDFEWPGRTNGARRLTEIAISMGIPVIAAHRALDDCRLLAACLSRVKNLDIKLLNAAKERAVYRLNCSYDDRQKAKEAGFIWNNLIPQAWAKRLTDEQATQYKENGFNVIKVEK